MDQQHQHWQGEERRQLSHIELQLQTLQVSVNDLRGAFPDGDVRGHCEAHQAMINAAKAQETFWSELKVDIAKKGLWFLLVTLCGFVWIGLLAKFGISAPK